MNNLKAYASYFVSFVIKELRELEKIKQIILFGSSSRGDETKESDVDIFIELHKKSATMEKEIHKLEEAFYRSREGILFKSRGIDNKINILVGKLNDWPDLKKSIESTGIVLYGPFASIEGNGKKFSIISWERIDLNRGALLNSLYGFKSKGKYYKGLIESFGGRKIGKSTIMIPVENRKKALVLLRKYKVDLRIIDVYV